ncbi:hypothetical protein HDU79_002716 [Rhizoclosmatium sp. JEL0117]|nr:hypothetical protein HDU99_003501 [Rhizoclosmatium hyalinum]KAJ3291048.1 hypothetical protein HDU79_002716 [Rhizoclosmatium sp. JEL0117]
MATAAKEATAFKALRGLNAYTVRQLVANASKTIDEIPVSRIAAIQVAVGAADRCRGHAAAALFAANELPRLFNQHRSSTQLRCSASPITKDAAVQSSTLNLVLTDNSTKSIDLSECKTPADIISKLNANL